MKRLRKIWTNVFGSWFSAYLAVYCGYMTWMAVAGQSPAQVIISTVAVVAITSALSFKRFHDGRNAIRDELTNAAMRFERAVDEERRQQILNDARQMRGYPPEWM